MLLSRILTFSFHWKQGYGTAKRFARRREGRAQGGWSPALHPPAEAEQTVRSWGLGWQRSRRRADELIGALRDASCAPSASPERRRPPQRSAHSDPWPQRRASSGRSRRVSQLVAVCPRRRGTLRPLLGLGGAALVAVWGLPEVGAPAASAAPWFPSSTPGSPAHPHP